MPEDSRLQDLLRIFANRAVAELRRLRAETAVREREEKLGRLVDGAMDAIVELDEQLAITHANAAAEQLFGCPSGRLIGRAFAELLTAEGSQTLERVTAEVRERPSESRYQWIAGGLAGSGDTGQTLSIEATVSTYVIHGKTFYTLILRNVSDRLEAEQRIHDLEEQAAYLREEIASLGRFDRIIGKSPALRAVLDEVEQVSPTDATVLILGETGTGKELFARAIHDGSPRSDRAMITVNCAAIPTHLIESELFGHEKGAFTGATQRRDGRFALADGGSLFLDEVGELPLELQGKLLRVLQEGEFEPVGSSRTREVDVRVIAATNRDLKAEAAAGRFREDLYYRLEVFPLRLPPLRERGDDAIALATEFARRFARDMGKEIAPLDEAGRARLLAYPWPGNVRELRNVIERAIITSRDGRLDLARALPDGAKAAPPDAGESVTPPAGDLLTADQLRELERANIERALAACDGKVAGDHGAARKLGMNPSTLSSRMKALGIRRTPR